MLKKCIICQSNNFSLLYPKNIDISKDMKTYRISESDYSKHLDIFKCQNCGFCFTDTDDTGDFLESYYSSMNDSEYESEGNNRLKSFINIMTQIQKLKPAGKLLDIGCATGILLNYAKGLNYEVSGIEPSDWAAEIARKNYNLDVKTAFLEDIELPIEDLDIILLTDVIEHVKNPSEVLTKVNSWLKKDGVVCLVTPNISAFFPRLLKNKWWHIRPAHLFYFDPETIKALLQKHGFEIVSIRNYKWYLSIIYLLERFLKLFNIVTPQNLKKTWLKKICVGIDLGDSMEIYAKKT